ncbi:MAG: hypothetical protein RMM17_06765 [Acidobacteriota bacterium]|nr:hypothetical protein [Blastocatellia bacterium]MDW8412365.1 hypothetical protein [Acidobacteriota bacterium]
MFGVIALFYFYTEGLSNIYGDGISHLNIARKVVDSSSTSLWERYVQLGSPWLPLQHLLMLPLVWQDFLWRSGLAGSIVSLAAYVLSVLLFFEIGSLLGAEEGTSKQRSVSSGFAAATLLCLNPSLIYLQTTPMSEPLFICAAAATVCSLMYWVERRTRRALLTSAAIAAISTLTRYEAWSLLPGGFLAIVLLQQGKRRIVDALIWAAISSLGLLYWLWHNFAIYSNPLEFLTGYYSARGIFARQSEFLGWSDFASGSLLLSLGIALLASAACCGTLSVIVALFTLCRAVAKLFSEGLNRRPRLSVALLLTLPFSFTVYGLMSGNIQIYPLSAIALLNVRYGIGLLLLLCGLVGIWHSRQLFLVSVLVLGQYFWMCRYGYKELAVVQEPLRNSVYTREARARSYLEEYLRRHPPKKKVLICGGDRTILHAGLHYRDVKLFYDTAQGLDLEGVETIVVVEGDALWRELSKRPLEGFICIYRVGPRPEIAVWERLYRLSTVSER